jgi:ABC-type multidrug transport system fused ATPase/permease subunit
MLVFFYSYFVFIEQDFLLLDNIDHGSCSTFFHDRQRRPNDDCCSISIDCITAKWPSANENENNTLSDITITVDSGQLLAIVGHVGSGKVHAFYLKPPFILLCIFFVVSRVPY